MPYQGGHFLMILNNLSDFVIALARSWPDSGGPVKFNIHSSSNEVCSLTPTIIICDREK
jgi:hypothetical protein